MRAAFSGPVSIPALPIKSVIHSTKWSALRISTTVTLWGPITVLLITSIPGASAFRSPPSRFPSPSERVGAFRAIRNIARSKISPEASRIVGTDGRGMNSRTFAGVEAVTSVVRTRISSDPLNAIRARWTPSDRTMSGSAEIVIMPRSAREPTGNRSRNPRTAAAAVENLLIRTSLLCR